MKMKPFMSEIQKRRAALEPAPGLPALGKRITVFTVNDLRKAPTRDVKVFGGIENPLRGPVAMHKGHVKVLGGVPAECALVVEEGICVVLGAVAGSLAATESCEVLESISGVVVVRRGDVRCAGILSPARVISKEGRVMCTHAQEPQMVFGAREVCVRGTAVGGVYMGRRVIVDEEILGGEIDVSELAQAKKFCCSQVRPQYIVLRRGFACQDYGEVLSADAFRMLTNAIKLRQRLEHVQHFHKIAEREADEYAGNVLVYLLGETDLSDQLFRIQRLQCRLAFVERLLMGAALFVRTIEQQVSALYAPDKSQAQSADLRETVLDLQRELAILASEGTIDRELFDIRELVLMIGNRIQRGRHTEGEFHGMLKKLADQMQVLGLQRKELAQDVDGRERHMETALGRASIMDRAKATGTRGEVLDQLLSAGRQRDEAKELRRKMTDRYARFMQRNIENRKSRSAEYARVIVDIESRLEKLRMKLWEEAMVSLPEQLLMSNSEEGARAVGHFDAGVRLCAWRHLVGETRYLDGIAVAPDTGDKMATFARTTHGQIEQVEAASETESESAPGSAPIAE
jgi:hypothetical protein